MRRLGKRDALVLAAFALISFAYFGSRLLPHPGRLLVGTGPDPQIFVWSFAWWPHAIGGWTNPLVTHALYAPVGANLAWATSIPGLALPLVPVTLLFGPIVSYNVAAVLLPALAAWSAYVLCLHLTRSRWASLVGGYLYGFSSFVLGHQLEGHLNLTGVFVLPLVALVVVRFLEGELSGRGFATRFGVLLALQLSISTELALSLTIMLALGLALAWLLVRELRPALSAVPRPLAAGFGLAALLASPLLAYAILGFRSQSFTGAEASSTDPLNVLFPTHLNALAGSLFPSISANFSDVESTLFLGPAALLIVVAYAWRSWRRPPSRLLVAGLALSFAISLGSALRVDGKQWVALPWTLTRHVPGLDNANAPRFSVYASLAVAVIVALWTAQARGRVYPRPYLLPLLAAATLVPVVWKSLYVSEPARPAFFSTGVDVSCIRNETVAVFPFGFENDSMVWQAESGLSFRLAGGYLWPLVFGAKPVSSFDADPTVYALNFLAYEARPTMDALLAFAGTHGIGRFVTIAGAGYPSERQLAKLGPVEQSGGVLVSPACGRPPLTTRNLQPYVLQEQNPNEIVYCLDGTFYGLAASLYPADYLRGAKRAFFVAGKGLSCYPPAGYTQKGFAPPEARVAADTYPLYAP